MYPKDKTESDKFAAGIIKLLHNEKTQPQIVKQLQDERAPISLRLGNIASQVIMRMVMLVQDQAGGRKPHFQLLVNAIKMTIKELAQMCQIIGIKVTPQDMQEASKIAGDLIEGGFGGQGQMQGPQMQQGGQSPPMQNMQQQKPGLVGGAM